MKNLKKPIIERLLPVPRDSGFRHEGYFVWGGSMIQVDDTYHLFASRWPESTGFPEGYRTHSEIVRATSKSPLGPYSFAEVVVSGRGGRHWDGQMCHNPKIVKTGATYLLYYIGSACGSKFRKVGYARALSIESPWQRLDEPLPLGEDANNPTPYIHADGSVLLAYRDESLHMYIVKAPSLDGPYETIASDIFPDGRLEDPDLWLDKGAYHMVMEDNQGMLTGSERHGGHLISHDGIVWRPHDPVRVYTHTIVYEDGSAFVADRRERPELFNANAQSKGNGDPTHLLTGVWYKGKAWCMVQAIASQPS